MHQSIEDSKAMIRGPYSVAEAYAVCMLPGAGEDLKLPCEPAEEHTACMLPETSVEMSGDLPAETRPGSPLSQRICPLDPLLQSACPLNPLSEGLDPLDPLPQRACLLNPLSEGSDPLDPLLQSPRPIGCLLFKFGTDTDLTDADDECEISAWIARPFWGKGLIPEGVEVLLQHGFGKLGMKRIWAGYYDGNEKSLACLKRCGFKAHHAERNIFLPMLGELRSGHIVVMTRADWEHRHTC